MWCVVLQLLSGLQAIHAYGLSCRVVDARHVLETERNRYRLGSVGVMDVLEPRSNQRELQLKDCVALGQQRQREVLARGTLTEDGDVRSFFFVSSLPWLHYSQLQHPAVSPDDSNPRMSWGKYVTVNGRTTLPVSLFVNHALADGLHISQFFRNLEQELAALCRQWTERK